MKLFEKNVGELDRAIRGLLGIFIISASLFLLLEPMNYIGIFVGAILLLTAITGTCSLYSLLKINTCKVKI